MCEWGIEMMSRCEHQTKPRTQQEQLTETGHVLSRGVWSLRVQRECRWTAARSLYKDLLWPHTGAQRSADLVPHSSVQPSFLYWSGPVCTFYPTSLAPFSAMLNTSFPRTNTAAQKASGPLVCGHQTRGTKAEVMRTTICMIHGRPRASYPCLSEAHWTAVRTSQEFSYSEELWKTIRFDATQNEVTPNNNNDGWFSSAMCFGWVTCSLANSALFSGRGGKIETSAGPLSVQIFIDISSMLYQWRASRGLGEEHDHIEQPLIWLDTFSFSSLPIKCWKTL